MTTPEDSSESNSETLVLPPKPKEPSQDDCCGNGCIPCVFDLYDQECKIWERSCLALRNFKDNESKKLEVVPLPDAYTLFNLCSITQITNNTFVYTFSAISNDQRINIGIGQHLVLRCYHNNDVITRQYSPISMDQHYFKVMIKLYENGKMSSYLRTLQEDMQVNWRGPLGEFKYIRNKYKNIVMLAAGTGIAPMVQIIEKITEDEQEETVIRLLYSCTKYDDILLKDKLDDFKAYWNFTILYALTKEDDKFKKKFGDQLYHDRIDTSLLAAELNKVYGPVVNCISELAKRREN